MRLFQDYSEEEFDRMERHAFQRLCGDEPLEEWEERVQEAASDWFSCNAPRWTREDWENVAHRNHPDDWIVLQYMEKECGCTDVRSAALACAEVREAAREYLDGVSGLNNEMSIDNKEDNT